MKVAVLRSDTTRYPDQPPFHPSVQYPELGQASIDETSSGNSVYGAVRHTLAMLGLDLSHFNTPYWNPLGQYVRPGDKVVIKPNFVLHEFGALKGTHCLTTHGSVIRAMVDYAFLAAGPDGSIVVADAPIQGADFGVIVKQTGLCEIQEYYWRKLHYEIKVLDLRQVRAVIDEGSSFIKEVKELDGDPLGYHVIDLGRQSRLSELDRRGTRYVVGDYNSAVTNSRHSINRHQYVVSNTMLDADVVLSVPKLKTHNKVGVTVCLKNLVGIIGSKDCLPHHRYGKTSHGGDEFPDQYPIHWYVSQRAYSQWQGRIPLPVWRMLRSWASRLLGAGTPTSLDAKASETRFYPSGSWYGNDTIWRTVDDLNRLLSYYDKEKDRLVSQRQRRFFAMVDGVIGMEGNGPLRGSPKLCGVLLAGDDSLAVDMVAATLMGFDWRRIRMLQGAAESPDALGYSSFLGDESAINIISNDERWRSFEKLKGVHLGFVPPAGWQGYVEI